jgi:prefoldin subunit 5
MVVLVETSREIEKVLEISRKREKTLESSREKLLERLKEVSRNF